MFSSPKRTTPRKVFAVDRHSSIFFRTVPTFLTSAFGARNFVASVRAPVRALLIAWFADVRTALGPICRSALFTSRELGVTDNCTGMLRPTRGPSLLGLTREHANDLIH
jgi:hypothetical protein